MSFELMPGDADNEQLPSESEELETIALERYEEIRRAQLEINAGF